MADCIFCKIIEGSIPSYTIFENDLFKAFLDINPATFGHTLIVPKIHAIDIFDVPQEYAKEMFLLSQKIATQIKQSLGCDGINILQNNGSVAGQVVFHYHMHLIPRYKNDNVRVGWEPLKPTQEEFENTLSNLLMEE